MNTDNERPTKDDTTPNNDTNDIFVKEIPEDDMKRKGVAVGLVQFRRTSPHGSTPYRVYYGVHKFVMIPNTKRGGWELCDQNMGRSVVWSGKRPKSSKPPFRQVAEWILDNREPPPEDEGGDQ